MEPDVPGYRVEAPLAGDRDPDGGRDAAVGVGRPSRVVLGRARGRDTPFDVVGSDGGEGPHARVWRAIRLADGTAVAVKVFALDQAGLARREAALLAAVDHPHVLTLLDVVSGPDHVGLVTDLAGGGSLRALLARRGRLTWQESLTVLIPLADALAAADERGLVHGDLSTGNVLFDDAGRPLLADLGAARAAAELSAPVAVTPTDVAPEVARGGVPDHRSDLFSLGSVALQCLSGRPAWPAGNLTDVLIQSTAGQWPDPDDAIAPEELLDILRRLLDPDPRRRGSAAAVAVDLRQVGEPAPVDLAGLGEDGLPRVAATVVRPDVAALRRADLTASHRRRRRSSIRQERSARASRPHHRPGTHRRPEAHPGRPQWIPRVRGLLLVLVVVVTLGMAAIRVGLWWAGSGRVDPAALLVTSVSGPGGTTASPTTFAAPSGFSGDDAASGLPAADGLSTDPVDWTAVVVGLDTLRSRALTARDPALLDLVYTPDSPARSADAGTIHDLVAAGYRLADARHDIGTVTPLSEQPARSVGSTPAIVTTAGTAVTVVESMPAIDVSDASGRLIGHTGASAPARVVLVLVDTGSGFRISSIRPG